MAKETKTVTLRLPVEQMEYLEQFEGSTNQTVVDLIDKVRTIEKYADRDIQGVFSEAEWKFLADSLNGTMVEGDFRFVKGALVAGVEDSATYDNLDQKWGVDVKDANTSFTLANVRVEEGYLVFEYDGKEEKVDMVMEDEESGDMCEEYIDGITEWVKFWRGCLRRAKRYMMMDADKLDAIQNGEIEEEEE